MAAQRSRTPAGPARVSRRRRPGQPFHCVRRVVGHVHGVGDESEGGAGRAALQEQRPQAPEVDAGHPAQVDHEDSRRLVRVPAESLGHLPAHHQPAAASQTAKILGWSPVIVHRLPSSEKTRRATSSPVPHRQRPAQHVGEVVLLPHQDGHHVDLVVGHDEVRAAVREVGGPPVLGPHGCTVLTGPVELGRGELADRLQGAEPRRAAILGHHQEGLVDQGVDEVGTGRSEHGGDGGTRHAVLEHREPGQRPLLLGREEVPRPGDDGLEGAVAVGGGAVATAQGGEPVLESGRHLGRRHGADPSGRELDRQRQPVQALHDGTHHLGVQDRVWPRGRGAAYEERPRVGCGELAQRDRAFGGEPEGCSAGGQDLEVARGREARKATSEAATGSTHVLAVVEHQQRRAPRPAPARPGRGRRHCCAAVCSTGRDVTESAHAQDSRRSRPPPRRRPSADAHQLHHAHPWPGSPPAPAPAPSRVLPIPPGPSTVTGATTRGRPTAARSASRPSSPAPS